MKSIVNHRQGTLELPYCKPGASDVLPPLWAPSLPRARHVYPYALNELVGSTFAPRTLQTLELENDYLKLVVLPELGGKLLSIYDKVAGHELLYKNAVLKPVMTGLTGAWCGTGMEFNFPGSHSVTSDRPVFCQLQPPADDGSVSIVIADRELVSAMRWQVTITLKPDSDVVHIASTCQNCTSQPHPGYWWTNAKIPAYPDTEFIFPKHCQAGAIHPPMDITRIHTWKLPFLKDMDLSKYKNVYFQLPLFFRHLRQNTFGLYHRDRDYGILQHADYGTLPGRKIWTLGTGDDGDVTNENVSEDGSRNIELQTGLMPVQTDFMLMDPGETRTWHEEWIPLRHMMDRHVATCPEFTVSTDGQGSLRIQCHRQGPDVILTSGNQQLRFTPEAGKIMDCQAMGDWKLCTPDGWTILQEEAGEAETEEAQVDPIQLDTPEAAYLQGRYCEENGQPEKARPLYEAALAKDHSYTPALIALATQLISWNHWSEARHLLTEALYKNRRSPETCYYLGLCEAKLGHWREAVFQLQRARTSASWKTAATARLAEVYFLRRQLPQLRELLQSPEAQDSQELLEISALMNQLGFGEFADAAKRLLTQSPEHPLPALLADEAPQAPDLRAVLLTVDRLYQLGLDQLAASKARIWQDQDPIAAYLAGNVDLAETYPVAGVFPPPELLERFERLAGAHPHAAKCHYYCGVLYAARKNWTAARNQWDLAWKEGMRDDALCRNLGLFHWHVAGDLKQAITYYETGFKPLQTTYKYVKEYDELLEQDHRHEARRQLFNSLPTTLRDNPYVIIRRAEFMLADGHPEKTLEELKGHHFVLCEGKRMSSTLFIKANCQLGEQALKRKDFTAALGWFQQALSYPHDLGTGKSAGMFDMKTKYLIVKTMRLAGQPEDSDRKRQEWLLECDKLNIDFAPLHSIRWEAGHTSKDELLEENLNYYQKLRDGNYDA